MVHEVPTTRVYVLVATVGVSLVACMALGYVTSPRDMTGRPVLLSPDVRATEAYRRLVGSWAKEWQSEVNALEVVISGKGELFTVSQEAQQIYTQAIELEAEVDATDTPAGLIGLHDQAQAVSQGCVAAGIAVARWVSAPSDDNRAAAEQALAQTKRLLTTLEANQWLQGVR